ncbi:ArsR/SmtB family transcription factor [Pseudomonas jinjuensis]|uniref:ArsR family transcriptional regulator n=1 Tax=Pseudomonas jinjuensis TaxID=198616 RepID=A0A1H0Q0E5_9PSED|nr:helix-turn-helix transcriptional regulator [Pseudomonas jinjuensis]SDP10927.1 ArsR family transcriptional regulator [Pseudomonas jinjuensis]
MTEPDIDLDEIIKALSHPVRREMLRWLQDPERHFVEQDHPFEIGVCAGKFDEKCGLSQSTVSAHLATLQRAGLVTSRKIGQWSFFRRNEETIQAFLRRLGEEL